jgi:hypothetical protein
LSKFRRGVENSKITTWDFRTDGARYFKSFLYNEALRLDGRQWAFLDKIARRDLGNPVCVSVKGRNVDLDYLLAAHELDFLADILPGCHSLLEIGVGFGRTCHSILSNFPNIRHYTIVDLPNCLELSRRYLQAVLPSGDFQKIRFVPNEDAESVVGPFDLAINIDSMMEMLPQVVDSYLAIIDRLASAFYTKNPVGKYHPSDLEDTEYDDDLLARALITGKLHQRIKMFDADDLETHVPAFLQAFRPGPQWREVKHAWSPPFSYFHQVIYRRN